MTGWKTKIGAAGMALLGLGTMVVGAVDFVNGDPAGFDKIQSGFLMLTGSLTAVGIGHKIEKAGVKG